MTRLVGLADQTEAHLAPFMPAGVVMSAVNPSKVKTAAKGALWVNTVKSKAQFKSIGTAVRSHRRRSETLEIQLAGIVYREARVHVDAAKDARQRLEVIVTAIETAIESDEDLSIGGAVDWTLVRDIDIELRPAEDGWVAMTAVTLECQSRPS